MGLKTEEERESETVERLRIDVYEGRGYDNPPIIGRIATLEGWRKMIEAEAKERNERFERKQNLVLGSVLSLLAAFIVKWLIHA